MTEVISGLENTLFDEFLGSRGSIRYNDAPTVEYPEYTQHVVFGTALLPRVYGKDLTAFEIASSGKVVISLDDVHSLDISRDSENSNVRMYTLCNDSFEINVNESNTSFRMDGKKDNIDIFAKNDFNLTTDDNIDIISKNNYNLLVDSNIKMKANTMDVSCSNNISLLTKNDFKLKSHSNINIEALTGNYKLHVNDKKMKTIMDDSTNSISTYALNDINMTASNNTTHKTYKDMKILADNNGTRRHSIDMKNSTNEFILDSTGYIGFNIDNHPLMSIDNSNINIFGHLNIDGVVNRENILETNMLLQDKQLLLATNSNFVDSDLKTYLRDGVANNKAGLAVHGVPENMIIPSGKTIGDVADYYEKSLRWYKNSDGVLGLGGDNPLVESQWELKGGSFYITNTRIDDDGEKIKDTSFGFRINQRDELELVKRYIPPGSNMYITKRVAKFGFSTDNI